MAAAIRRTNASALKELKKRRLEKEDSEKEKGLELLRLAKVAASEEKKRRALERKKLEERLVQSVPRTYSIDGKKRKGPVAGIRASARIVVGVMEASMGGGLVGIQRG